MDTSVAIHLSDGDDDIVNRADALGGDAAMSVVTQVELEGGVYRDASQAERRRARVDALVETVAVLPFDSPALDAYREIVRALGFSRSRVIDRMIASQAIASGLPLVTINGADFKNIPGLQLLVWPSTAKPGPSSAP